MVDIKSIGSDSAFLVDSQSTDTGNLNGKKVVQSHKPLFIVLIILGIAGIGVGCAGLASFGAHQGWWIAGGMSNLSQINAIILMAAGGGVGLILFTTGVTGVAQIESEIANRSFTLKMIQRMEIGEYKRQREFPHAKLYECTIEFSNGKQREVYLTEGEISNFVEVLDSAKIVNHALKKFTSPNRLVGFRVKDVLAGLDGKIAARVDTI